MRCAIMSSELNCFLMSSGDVLNDHLLAPTVSIRYTITTDNASVLRRRRECIHTYIHIYSLKMTWHIKSVHKQVQSKTFKAQEALTAASTTN